MNSETQPRCSQWPWLPVDPALRRSLSLSTWTLLLAFLLLNLRTVFTGGDVSPSIASGPPHTVTRVSFLFVYVHCHWSLRAPWEPRPTVCPLPVRLLCPRPRRPLSHAPAPAQSPPRPAGGSRVTSAHLCPECRPPWILLPTFPAHSLDDTPLAPVPPSSPLGLFDDLSSLCISSVTVADVLSALPAAALGHGTLPRPTACTRLWMPHTWRSCGAPVHLLLLP